MRGVGAPDARTPLHMTDAAPVLGKRADGPPPSDDAPAAKRAAKHDAAKALILSARFSSLDGTTFDPSLPSPRDGVRTFADLERTVNETFRAAGSGAQIAAVLGCRGPTNLWYAVYAGLFLRMSKRYSGCGWRAQWFVAEPDRPLPGCSDRTSRRCMALAALARSFPGLWRCGLTVYAVQRVGFTAFGAMLRGMRAQGELAPEWNVFV